MQEQVLDFHEACDLPAPSEPTMQDMTFVRCQLILEEAGEFVDAFHADEPIEMIDALCDLLYVTYGAAVAMGVDLEPFFNEVHRTNMEKTKGPKRPDGKQLKPPGWQPPDLKGVFRGTYPGVLIETPGTKS